MQIGILCGEPASGTREAFATNLALLTKLAQQGLNLGPREIPEDVLHVFELGAFRACFAYVF